jgi:hypothetical protein
MLLPTRKGWVLIWILLKEKIEVDLINISSCIEFLESMEFIAFNFLSPDYVLLCFIELSGLVIVFGDSRFGIKSSSELTVLGVLQIY